MLACGGMLLMTRQRQPLDVLSGKWYIFARIWCYV